MSEQLALLPGYLTAHLQLVLFALLFATAISVPLGVALSRSARLEPPVLLLASLIQTIPSLALLALMVPLLALFGLPSIGYLPAFIALVLYGILPVLRNTVTGLATIDSAVSDSARAVGMTPREQLLRVELPLALPVIVAGFRTAIAWTVGMATLSTPVGGTSLGNYIFSGLQTRNYASVLVGCIGAGLLALVLDGLARLLLSGIERRRRARIWSAAAGFLGLYLYAGVSLALSTWPGNARSVLIGAKTFTEQYILSELLAETVRRESGQPATVLPSLGSSVAFDALRNGQIDAYVDYSGTLWATILKRQGRPPARQAVLDEVREFLREQYGIRLLGSLGFENAYALAVRRTRARELDIATLSQLSPHAPELSIGADYEFLERPEWRSLVDVYGFHFGHSRSMDPSLLYQAIGNGNVDVISAFSTDGRVDALDLTLLADDRGAIPPYDAVLLVGRRIAEHQPRVLHALESLLGRIDDSAMRRLNSLVDGAGQQPAQVARGFLDGSPQSGATTSERPAAAH